MSGEHSTPVGTPVVIAPGRIVIIGEYAALAEGSAVAAAVGCFAKAQFIPRMEPALAMVSETIDRIKAELHDVAAALPPGSVLLTNEDFRRAGAMAAGLGGSAAMAVAAAGAVFETLGLALESRKPLVFRIAEEARRATQGYEVSGADIAASTYGGLIRVSRPPDGPVEVLPMAPPAGFHLVVFSAEPSIPPGEVVRALERHAARDLPGFREAVSRLREAAQRFLDEVAAGQATAAVAAAGRYGQILQDLCAAADAPIMNEAFKQAALLAQEFGGIAKPTGSGGGDVGVGLFATPEAARWFRKACTGALVALDGDLDPSGVRCEFPDNSVGGDLDERDSAETPAPEPDEFCLPTVVTAPPVLEDAHEAPTARNPVDGAPATVTTGARDKPASRGRGLAVTLLVLGSLVAAWLAWQRWNREPPSPAPPRAAARPSPPPPATTRPAPEPPVQTAVEPVRQPSPLADQPSTKAEDQPAKPAKRRHGRRVAREPPASPRGGRLSTDDF
jgi:mevalonate kinase